MPGIVVRREPVLTLSHDLPGSRSHKVLARHSRQTLDEPWGFDMALLPDVLREKRACLLQVLYRHPQVPHERVNPGRDPPCIFCVCATVDCPRTQARKYSLLQWAARHPEFSGFHLTF